MLIKTNKKAKLSWGVRVLFFLLLSGPPKLRLRDPSASLDVTIDAVIVVQILVWVVAGCWVMWNLNKWSIGKEPENSRFSALELMSAILFALLALSVLFSEAPAFSAFKVYQLVVTFSFVTLFLKKFGIAELLNNLFIGCAILALADILAAAAFPDLVFFESELGVTRFRGDLIAQTGNISVIGLFLLLTVKSDLPTSRIVFWGMILGGVLIFSLSRTSYIAVLVVLALAVCRRPAIPLLRHVATLVLLTVPLVFGILLEALDSRRAVDDIWTLSDRLGLWAYLVDVTTTRGPWTGLGYFAASRVYAPEYNPGLGTAHSAFMEVYVGGGVISLAVFISIWIVVAVKATRLYLSHPDRTGFAIVSLFCAALLLNAIGGELQADPAGCCFWSVVAALPLVSLPCSKRALSEEGPAAG